MGYNQIGKNIHKRGRKYNMKTEEIIVGNNPKMSDEEYWKQYKQTEEEGQNHEISIDVLIKFKGINGQIFETKEKNINCNLNDLQTFFNNLKRTIRMLDETKSDDEGY